MVSLGEGLMPKGGETPEMGSNPLLGFGRVYARPQVARYLDRQVHKLINDRSYQWDDFWRDLRRTGITVWGAAIDTLENTTGFAKGAEYGPLTVLHLFDQPLEIALPYEGYMGTLALPKEVVDNAARHSILVNYSTPRKLVLDSILECYPGITPERVHVWTLGGKSRVKRLSSLWKQWDELGVHRIQEGYILPTGMPAFIQSGTYAPTFRLGPYKDPDGQTHLLIADGYAASAEAIQAASLDPIFDIDTSLCLFSSKFEVDVERERHVMQIDPEAEDLANQLESTLGIDLSPTQVEEYRRLIRNARDAGMPLSKNLVTVDDFFPDRRWRVLAVAGYMLPDPYTGAPGIEMIDEERKIYRVTTRAATGKAVLEVSLDLRLMDPWDESRLVFSPLLDRFYAGTDYRTRAVKVSDSGRIRNELQTLASEALEHRADGRIRIRFEAIGDAVMAPEKKQLIREVLDWYKNNHPIWFKWLDTP